MKDFYKNKKDMHDDFIENEQDFMMRESMNDSIKAKNSKKAKAKRIFFRVLVVSCLFIFIIKVFYGNIYIDSTSKANDLKTMMFEVKINRDTMFVRVDREYKKPIIPWLIYKRAETSDYYNYDKAPVSGSSVNNLTWGGTYVLQTNALYCYYLNEYIQEKATCELSNSSDYSFVKSSAPEYDKLIISREKTGEKVYEGKYIFDITEYVLEPAIYDIIIIASYDNVNANIKFKIQTFEEN